MRKLLMAAAAASVLAGHASAEPKMSREAIIVSTMDGAKNDNWVGGALTFIVFILAIGGSGSGFVGPG